MPPSFPTYSTLGSCGSNTRKCWSTWIPPLTLAKVAPPSVDRYSEMPPKKTVSALRGWTASVMSYQHWEPHSAFVAVSVSQVVPPSVVL